MPRWGIDPITLDRSDTLQSALGKLATSENVVPVVLISSDCRIGDNVLLYRLLDRHSKQSGIPLAVVSSNPYRRRLAREHGLYAFGSLGALKRAKGRSPIAWLENLADSLFFSMRPTISRQGWVIIGLFSILAGVLAYLFVPQLTVTIRLPAETLNREFQVRVDASLAAIDPSAPAIPGRIMEHRFTVSDFVDTTGDRKIGKARARGEVTVVSNDPTVVTFPEGSIVSTSSGIRFRTTATANLSAVSRPASPTAAAGTQSSTSSVGVTRVPIEAVEPGEAGNVPARAISKVEGDAFRNIAVFNEQPTTGGSDSNARTVSTDDRSRLKEALFQKAQSQSLSELTLRVRQSESLIPHSLQVRIENEEFDKEIDAEADRLRGTSYVVATGIAFANQEFNTVVEREWRKSVPKEYRPLSNPLEITPPEVVDAGARMATLRVKVAGRVEAILDLERLSETLRGLSVAEARQKLSAYQSSLKIDNVEIWPSFAQRALRVEVKTTR